MVPTPKDSRFSLQRVRRSLLRILEGNVLCSIATVTSGHKAHISHVYFCYNDHFEFYFLSDPSSVHCRNQRVNRSMAMTVFNSAQPCDRPGRGIQMFGVCSEATTSQTLRAEQAYGKRFPRFGEWKSRLTGTDSKIRYRFYRFVPRKVKILDEPRFGGGVFVLASIRRPSMRGEIR